MRSRAIGGTSLAHSPGWSPCHHSLGSCETVTSPARGAGSSSPYEYGTGIAEGAGWACAESDK